MKKNKYSRTQLLTAVAAFALATSSVGFAHKDTYCLKTSIPISAPKLTKVEIPKYAGGAHFKFNVVGNKISIRTNRGVACGNILRSHGSRNVEVKFYDKTGPVTCKFRLYLKIQGFNKWIGNNGTAQISSKLSDSVPCRYSNGNQAAYRIEFGEICEIALNRDNKPTGTTCQQPYKVSIDPSF